MVTDHGAEYVVLLGQRSASYWVDAEVRRSFPFDAPALGFFLLHSQYYGTSFADPKSSEQSNVARRVDQ